MWDCAGKRLRPEFCTAHHGRGGGRNDPSISSPTSSCLGPRARRRARDGRTGGTGSRRSGAPTQRRPKLDAHHKAVNLRRPPRMVWNLDGEDAWSSSGGPTCASGHGGAIGSLPWRELSARTSSALRASRRKGLDDAQEAGRGPGGRCTAGERPRPQTSGSGGRLCRNVRGGERP
ncbi:hypothetical protein BC628DRAFT_245120 [Trametes gibbosa]|nr:hypothetical protein BC628DRAFT_245120 [Trametes gibbosa]